MKKLLLAIVLATVGYVGYVRHNAATNPTAQTQSVSSGRLGAEASDTQVQGAGIVSRILSDDTDGSRHQRFIIRLQSGQTLLVAHNIDLAPRIDDLKEGDIVEYSGEYQWNPKGGVVHWTHRDPSGQHVAGWLKHDGRSAANPELIRPRCDSSRGLSVGVGTLTRRTPSSRHRRSSFELVQRWDDRWNGARFVPDRRPSQSLVEYRGW